MAGVIQIEYPESLAHVLRLKAEDFKSEIKTSGLVKLYELGRISSSVAANVLGIPRLEFLDLLSKYKVSIWGQYDLEDLHEDITNA